MLTQTVAGRVYDYSHSVGQYVGGTNWSDELFVQPIATATSRDDVVYVLGRGAESTDDAPTLQPRAFGARVGKFTIGSTPGDEENLTTFGSYGGDEGQFIWPAGMALDSHQNVYVTDEWLNRVTVFDDDGNFLGLWGSPGREDGSFNRPSGVAVDNRDNLYVVDSLNHRVQKYTTEGAFLAGWGGFGAGEGEFDSPWGVAVDNNGYVYVADHKNHRVQKFSEDGRFVAQFGAHGSGRGKLNRPSDVAIDPDGDVYVCDWANSRVQVLSLFYDYVSS